MHANGLVFLAEYLGLDVNKVTEKLKESGVGHAAAAGDKFAWMGKSLEVLRANATDKEHFHVDELDCYHGDFKHRKRHRRWPPVRRPERLYRPGRRHCAVQLPAESDAGPANIRL